VFGFDHVLWAYLPELGTVALGPLTGDTSLTPEIITRRLRAADPAIRDVEIFRDARARSTPPRLLHNGCFLGCIVGLIGLLENGVSIQEAGFVFLTVDPGADSAPVSRFFTPQGHALLVYRTGAHWFALDPRHADQPIDLAYIRPGEPTDTRLLDYAVRQNYPATAAHYLPVSPATLAHLDDDVVWLRRDARLQQGLVAL
jgi:hypothetical protein